MKNVRTHALAYTLAALFSLCFAKNTVAQAELSGRVTDDQGQPLTGASVVLLDLREGTFTDAEGRYRFEGLKPGKYKVRTTYLGFEKQTRTTAVPEGYVGLVLMHFQLTPAESTLDEIVVKATRAGEKAPFTSTTVSREYLESQNLGQDIPILLDATPSVVVNSDAGAGFGYTGLRIRGTDPTRINVTINGIPLNDAESHNVFWVDLPDFASSTEDIQIQRGVGTSTNGAAAFGASINLNTSKLIEKPYGEVATSIGSFDTRKLTLKFGLGLFNPFTKDKNTKTGFTLDGRFSKIKSDGYIDRASVDLGSGYASLAYYGKKFSLRANAFVGQETTYQAWNGVPAQYVNDDELRTFNVSGTDYFSKEGEPHDREVDDYSQENLQLLYSHELSRNWQLNMAGHYTYGNGFFEQYKVGENLVDRYELFNVCNPCEESDIIRQRWLDNDFFGGIASLSYTSNGGQLENITGGGWNQYLGRHFGIITWSEVYDVRTIPIFFPQYYEGEGNKTDLNIYNKTQYSFTPYLHGFLDLQYRRINYKITGRDNDLRETEVDTKYDFFNPKAGVTFDFSENGSIYGSFAVANREPNRSDFTDATPGTTPKPERLLNTEVGVNYKLKNGQFGANIYHMKYEDQLVLTGNINDVGGPIRVNVPDSYRLGLELVANYRFSDRISIDANATFSRNKIESFTEYIDNWDTGGQDTVMHGTTDIAFSPSAIAFGRINYSAIKDEKNELTFSFSMKHVGEQFIDNASNKNTTLAAYTIGGAQLRYILKPKFTEEISLNLLVNNLFDLKYSANAWTYRYISEFYDGRPDDPYTRLESGSTYNLTGFFPQAGRNFLLGLTVKF